MEERKDGEDLPLRHHLYRHFDAGGKLLYVGISLSAVQRLAQHRDHSRWFGEIASVRIESFETRAAAIEAERKAIQAERPLHNVVHNRNVVPLPVKGGGGVAASRSDLVARLVRFAPLYSLQQAADALSVSTGQVNRWIDDGKLACVRVDYGASSRKKITGWQLIDFLEFLQASKTLDERPDHRTG